MKTTFAPSLIAGLLVALSVSSATGGALPGPQPSHRSDRSIAQQAIEMTAQIKETRMAAAAVLTPEELVTLGEDLFFNGTFDGNGRTCGSCHRREDAFGLSPASIAALPDNDPLFVAEFDANLTPLEHPPLMHSPRGLILENIDGFGQPPVFRNSPASSPISRSSPPER
jgi:cytochrome c peroxidase